jgi:hypothetical protein
MPYISRRSWPLQYANVLGEQQHQHAEETRRIIKIGHLSRTVTWLAFCLKHETLWARLSLISSAPFAMPRAKPRNGTNPTPLQCPLSPRLRFVCPGANKTRHSTIQKHNAQGKFQLTRRLSVGADTMVEHQTFLCLAMPLSLRCLLLLSQRLIICGCSSKDHIFHVAPLPCADR